MILRLDILETAYADLEDLGRYIEAEADQSVADAYDARIRAKISTITNYPNRGTDRSMLGAGYALSPSSGGSLSFTVWEKAS